MTGSPMDNFQRIGAKSNAHVGRAFEVLARDALRVAGIEVQPKFSVAIGVGSHKKEHEFDLGSTSSKVLVECKSHRWTTGGNTPSAKVTVWNEVMFYFTLAPADYRKILFVLRDVHATRKETLAEYYLRNHGHLVPRETEIWEYDESNANVKVLRLPT